MPKGGARPGAGRPPGTKNTKRFDREEGVAPSGGTGMPPREVRGHRAPANADPAEVALVARALSRIQDVMEQRVHPQQANGVLKAAEAIIEELCGPSVQKVEQRVEVDLRLADLIKMLDATDRPGTKPVIVLPPITVPALPAPEE
jgi:hypothetical protein